MNPTPKKRSGRPIGFSPINGKGKAMVKKNKAWSMPDEDWDWLESQSNQSEIIRRAIAQYRRNIIRSKKHEISTDD